GLGDERAAQSVADRRREGGVKDVAVVVVNYNGADTVLDTLESVFAQQDVTPRVTVVDDGSIDGSPDAIAQRFPQVQIHREPRNTKDVNRLRNIGVARAVGDK